MKLRTEGRVRQAVGFIVFSFIVLSSQFLFAADFQVSASLDRNQIALNEQAVLSLTVSGNATDLPQPELPGLTNFQISNAGKSQNFSWINGQASASVTYSYVLTPLQEGHFTIPPIRVQYQGQTAETPTLSLDVVKGEAGAIPAVPTQSGTSPASSRGAAAIFITGTVDKSTVYVDEPVTYIFRLYNRVALLSRPGYQPPETPGFWAEDLPPQRTYTTQIKGVPYNVTEVRTALFPTTPGTAHIGSATLSVHLENLGTDPFSSNFFANFFGQGEEKLLRTEPVTVHVKALPDPKPSGFKGAVGHYVISSNMDKETASVGQPLTLTVTVSGRGNIKSLPDLPLPPLNNFRTFDANAASNIEKKDGEVAGSKVFKTVLIPTASGDVRIPPISFVYFDPAARAYKTISSRPFTVHVTPAAAGANAPVQTFTGPATAPGIHMLGEDIRYIKTPSEISSQRNPLYRNRFFLVFNGLVLAGVFGTGLFALYLRLFHSNLALTRFRAAKEQAESLVLQAEEAIGRSEIKKSAELLADALHGYLASKLAVEERELSLKTAIEKLRSRGVHSHDTEKVRNLWEMLDLFQFAPTQVRPDEVRQAARTLKHVIDEVEKDVLWKD